MGAGELVGLIGPNGAGKTSLLDAITGFVPSTGEVRFGGRRVDATPVHRRVRAGLARTFQTIELFEDLTVAENVSLGAAASSDREAPLRLLAELGIDAQADRVADTLSLGERKYVALARAMAAAPTCLLLDEPAAGLDQRESAQLGEFLLRLCEGGVSILLVEHDMTLVRTVCSDLYVLDFGRIISSGPTQTVMSDPKVITAYLGELHTDVVPA